MAMKALVPSRASEGSSWPCSTALTLDKSPKFNRSWLTVKVGFVRRSWTRTFLLSPGFFTIIFGLLVIPCWSLKLLVLFISLGFWRLMHITFDKVNLEIKTTVYGELTIANVSNDSLLVEIRVSQHEEIDWWKEVFYSEVKLTNYCITLNRHCI